MTRVRLSEPEYCNAGERRDVNLAVDNRYRHEPHAGTEVVPSAGCHIAIVQLVGQVGCIIGTQDGGAEILGCP